MITAPENTDDVAWVMTVHEVAKYLRLSEATVYRLAKARRIPAARIGRTWRFQRQLVEEWMRQEASALTNA